MAIKNIVFDMGGVVLTKAEKNDVYNALSFKEDTDQVFDLLFHSKIRVEMDRGAIEHQKGLEIIYASLPERSRKEGKEFFEYYMSHRKITDGMLDLFEALKKNGYDLYVLSNFSTEMKAYMKMNGYSFLDDFKKIFNSSEHKMIKPDKEIYEEFLSLYHLSAEECFFTDDREKNVISAIECGFKGATFTDCKNLILALRKEGVNI